MNGSERTRYERRSSGPDAKRRLRLALAVVLTLASLQALAVVASPPAGAADGGAWQWVHQLDTNTDSREAFDVSSVAADGAGNVYVTGQTWGELPGSSDTHAGETDVFVASWDINGTPRWVHQLGTTSYDFGLGVAVDTDGNVYVTGQTRGELPGSSDTHAGESDVFVASWDSNGTARWVHQLGTTDDDGGGGVAVDASGNVYVTGYTDGTLPGSSDTHAGESDVFVASWDSNGTRRWVHQLGTTLSEEGRGVAVDASGNFYVTGYTEGMLPGSPDTNAGGYDVFVTSWDSNGTARWVHQLGTTDDDGGGGVAVDASGNVYVTGYTEGMLPGSSDTHAGESDVFVASWDSNGTARWVHQLGTTDDDGGGGVAVDADANVYVTGYTNETLPGSSDTNAGESDVFVASWDSNGTARWVRQLGTTDDDGGYEVAVDTDANVYISGSTWGTLPGSPETNAGGLNVFIARMAPAATNQAPVAADQTLTTTTDTPLPVTLAATDDGLPDPPATLNYTIVTDPTNGTLTGTAPDLTYTPNTGYTGEDTFTFKANDTELDSEPATITITIEDTPPTNEAPVAADQTLTTTTDTPLPVTLAATDDGLPDPPATLNYTIVTDPTNGTLTGTAPDLTYTPNTGYSGEDTFTFKANDTELDSEPATITITIEDGGGELADTRLSAMNALSWRTRDGQIVIPHAWVRLTDTDTGAGIADQDIVLTVDGQQLCTATTRTHGWASCGGTITGDATTIAAGYDATYAGDDTHAPSDDHGNLFELRRRHHPRTNWWWWKCTNHNHGHNNHHHTRNWR